ncbi:uncharacterized protein LOC143922764 [Arctopsyche grandis]|uniref:uncharacterized protein LOC143922764 n=1 Tax=Arctopsyche grandis TaxID=121162 RepID=UPI00406D7C66
MPCPHEDVGYHLCYLKISASVFSGSEQILGAHIGPHAHVLKPRQLFPANTFLPSIFPRGYQTEKFVFWTPYHVSEVLHLYPLDDRNKFSASPHHAKDSFI